MTPEKALAEALEEIKRLRETLRFYAREKNEVWASWQIRMDCDHGDYATRELKKKKRARSALQTKEKI